MRAFKDYSHSARRCYQFACELETIAELESSINSLITNPPPFSLTESTIKVLLKVTGNAEEVLGQYTITVLSAGRGAATLMIIRRRRLKACLLNYRRRSQASCIHTRIQGNREHKSTGNKQTAERGEPKHAE